MSRKVGTLVCLVVLAALVGCAGRGAPGAEAIPTPTPTAACPQIEGVELPPECAPYDPDAAMAQNERYRERMELPEEAAAAAQEFVAPVQAGLEEIRVSGTISIETVEQVITDAGLPQPQLRSGAGDVLFGVAGPEGGCVFGAVTPEEVTIEVGGNIMDGGCLPAQ